MQHCFGTHTWKIEFDSTGHLCGPALGSVRGAIRHGQPTSRTNNKPFTHVEGDSG